MVSMQWQEKCGAAGQEKFSSSSSSPCQVLSFEL
jgi:hypothetical protein